jgi:O-antigen/teichoic acid export membrane protein
MIRGTQLALTKKFRAQSDLLENALSLGGSTVVTSILGAVYWWIAARLLDPVSVGYGSAATSAATLLATFGMAGYGSLLLGHVANSGTSAGSLIATGLTIAGGASLIIGGAYGLFVHGFDQSFAPYCETAAGIALFAATASLTGVTTVLDDALVGLFLGPVQLKRNTVFAVAKVVVLSALAVVVPDRSGGDVLASWTLGLAVSLVAVTAVLSRQDKRVWHSPRMIAFRRSAKTAMMHHWINLALVAPRLGLPLLVTGLLSATANGLLYPAWIVATLAYVVPQHLSTSLFAVGAADRSMLAAKTRTSIKIALVAGVPSTLLVALLAHPLLSVFGSAYAQHATVPMRWLMLAYVPNVIRFHYVTVLRVQGRLVRAATVLTGLGVLEIAAIVVGSQTAGLSGVAAALTAAMWVEGFATALPVLRVMRGDPSSFPPSGDSTAQGVPAATEI